MRAAQSRQPREGRPVLQHRAPASSAPAPAGFGREPRPRTPESARGGPESPRGTVWLYGQHAVASALANPQRRLRRLLLTEEAEAAMAGALRQKVPGGQWPIQPERTERARLDQLLGRDVVHQGAALLADPLSPPALAQALERPGPVLVLDQVTGPAQYRRHLDARRRGVRRGRRDHPGTATRRRKPGRWRRRRLARWRRRAAVSRGEHRPHAGGAEGGRVLGGGAGRRWPGRLSGPSLAQRRVALVLGSEGEGMRRLTRDTCDEVAGIAMPRAHASDMESLNVSAAAAIALYELTRPT